MNFVDASKKRINPSAKENMSENVFKFLNDKDPERMGDYCWSWTHLNKHFLSLWNHLKKRGAPRGAILKNQINHLIMPARVIGHKTPDLETYFSNSLEIRQQKNDEFLKKLTVGNLVCIKTRYSFKLAKTLSMTKNAKSQDRDILKSPWLLPWGTLTKIAHFSEILLSHDPLFG